VWPASWAMVWQVAAGSSSSASENAKPIARRSTLPSDGAMPDTPRPKPRSSGRPPTTIIEYGPLAGRRSTISIA
jgi:hypothetical protein